MTAAIAVVGPRQDVSFVRAERREVDVGGSGHVVQIAWPTVPGATDVEVTSASATIGNALVTSVQDVPVSVASDGQSRDLIVPSGGRVISLGLSSLAWVHTVPTDDGDKDVSDHLDSESALWNSDVRLVVSTPDARNQMAPVYAVPQVGRQGVLPPQFGGASYSNSALDLKSLKAAKVRVMLTEGIGKPPQEWQAARTECGALSATIGFYPSQLELEGSDGAGVWAFPNELSKDVPDATVDLAAPVRAALATALKAKQPLEYGLTLRAKGNTKAHFTLRIDGAVVRSYATDVGTSLEGEGRSLALDGEPLGAEVPASVTADVSIQYAGVRLLDEVNDAIPAAGGASGVILTQTPTLRSLPRPAFGDLPIVRVGVIGRAPEKCELSLQLVETHGDVAGAAYGDAGTVTIDPSGLLDVHWIDLPAHRPLGSSVALALRATSGRFFWVKTERFLARAAVKDPNPGGRAVTIAGKSFALENGKGSAGSRYDWKGVTLPASAFTRPVPQVSSRLFAKVNVRDLTLRYARQVSE